jgi:hypothetical protein
LGALPCPCGDARWVCEKDPFPHDDCAGPVDAEVRSKSATAQINEALLKLVCHNLCCVIQEMNESGISGAFAPGGIDDQMQRRMPSTVGSESPEPVGTNGAFNPLNLQTINRYLGITDRVAIETYVNQKAGLSLEQSETEAKNVAASHLRFGRDTVNTRVPRAICSSRTCRRR